MPVAATDIPPVKWLRLMAVMIVGAVWIAATNHCALEAAGIMPGTLEAAGHGCCDDGSPGCETDNCFLVEDGAVLHWAKIVSVQAPAACECNECLHALSLPEPEFETVLPAVESEPWIDWLPAWQFERRAVLPARAPAKLNA